MEIGGLTNGRVPPHQILPPGAVSVKLRACPPERRHGRASRADSGMGALPARCAVADDRDGNGICGDSRTAGERWAGERTGGGRRARTSHTALRTILAGTDPSISPSAAPSPRLPTTMRLAGVLPIWSSASAGSAA